jgi:5-methylcytosine-specific restriction endonuclease McrA
VARLFNENQRQAMRLLSGNRCELCGAKLDRSFHADHLKPFSKGGETILENGQALCKTCNLRKGAKHHE